MEKGIITNEQFDNFIDTLTEAMYNSEFYNDDLAETLPNTTIFEWAKTWGIMLLADVGIDRVKLSSYND